MSEGGKEAVRAHDDVLADAEVLALQKQTRELPGSRQEDLGERHFVRR